MGNIELPTETIENYLSDFHRWMLEKGRLDGSGYPAEPLSPRTASNRFKKIRRILVDMGFLMKEYHGGNTFRYSYTQKRIQDFTTHLLIQWFSKEFPILPDFRAKQRKNDYVEAVYKFAQFLHFELEIWNIETFDE